MRQLLIVKSAAALGYSPINAGLTDDNVQDLSGLVPGGIAFFELGAATALEAPATKNFAIALGRPNGQHPLIIPEVDIKTLRVTKALPFAGATFSVVFTVPSTVAGEEYTLRFFKKGVVPHERNSWTVGIVASTNNASYQEAAALKKAMDDKVNDKFNFTTTRSNGQLTITCNNIGEDWEVAAIDSLAGTSLVVTHAEKPIGDKKYIQELASFCAAGKGFYHTNGEGRDVIPGYPEYVEDFELNDSGDNQNGKDDTDGVYSTEGYAIYTLRFMVGRDASKTRDERVWQNVYIACPLYDSIPVTRDGSEEEETTQDPIAYLDSILPEGDYYNNILTVATAAASDDGGSGSGSGSGRSGEAKA